MFEKNRLKKPESVSIGKKLPEKVRQLAREILETYWNIEDQEEKEALEEQKFASLLEQAKTSYAADKEELEGEKKLVIETFKEVYPQSQAHITIVASIPSKSTLVEAINIYHNKLRDDISDLHKRLLSQSQTIYNSYLRSLAILVEMIDLVNGDRLAQASNLLKKPIFEGDYKMGRNVVCLALKDSENLQNALAQHKIVTESLQSLARELYRKVIREDEAYIDYQKLGENNPEDDKKITNHILKNIIFKHEISNAYFEELDLSWSENRKVVQSMASKTIKSILGDVEKETEEAEEGESEEKVSPTLNKAFELSPLSKNWDEDVVFYKHLYKYNVEGNQKHEDIIAGKTKNWDIERLALMDKVILKMAICEMINFYSIPVKVTINEYIELAKTYSTPKSKKFVNGLLDSIAQDLVARGDIKKSGRGLMDNK